MPSRPNWYPDSGHGLGCRCAECVRKRQDHFPHLRRTPWRDWGWLPPVVIVAAAILSVGVLSWSVQ